MMTTYLPKCCWTRPDGAGGYEVAHAETDPSCRHIPSGGTAGYMDGRTRCNRIIGKGRTRTEARLDARTYFALPAFRAA
jgi:hypothetical protein